MQKKSNKKFTHTHTHGFTLAEILITLGIIGVVSVMTISPLVQDLQEKELKNSWKELYSQLSQATSQIIADNGGTLVGVCDANSSEDPNYLPNNSDCMANLYASEFKTTSAIRLYNSAGGWPGIASYKFLKGDIDTGNILRLSRFQINNGAILYMYRFSNNNGLIVVDVNGPKGPNTYGKDTYRMWIRPNSINAATGTCDPTITGSGAGCSAKYLLE